MSNDIKISDYTYSLPHERIALHPLNDRDKSKMLLYKKGAISHTTFDQVPEHVPADSILFFNNSKVIQARLHFEKDTGAVIEVFLLNPVRPSILLLEAMQSTGNCTWNCTIGNLKRWSVGAVLEKKLGELTLAAKLLNKENGLVQFTWDKSVTFAEILEVAGETPLPPYLKRNAIPEDKERYQTVYSHIEGAVAAPTAGLHFTPRVLEDLKARGIELQFLTLHVSAGTFLPVKTENAAEHQMHQEQVLVTRQNVESLLRVERFTVAVGTTSLRTLESLYWFGVALTRNPNAAFDISQQDAYTQPQEVSRVDALRSVLLYMDSRNLDTLVGETSIYIMPGYKFRICDGLITNFHQPGSTLILLVAAFIGKDWKKVYDEALQNGYRFLSYGDSSLLIP